jgi:NAD(P)H-flavin reductase
MTGDAAFARDRSPPPANAPPALGARVLDAWDETATLRAIRAALPRDWTPAHARPGQVVKVHADGAEGWFALANAPAGDGVIELLVKRGGRVADAAIAAATPGGTLLLSPPTGKGFPVGEAHGRDVLLFAAGAGIAPIRALVQHVVAHRADFHGVTLFYGQRRGGDFAYAREHLAWERGGVRVVLCPSAEDEAWGGVRGRVHDVARSTAFCGSPPRRAVAFVCGMRAMVDEVRATLADTGLPPARVHLNF